MNARRPEPIRDEQLRDALMRRPDAQRLADDLVSIVAAVEQTRQRRAPMTRWLLVAALLTALALLLATLGLASIVGSPHHVLHPTGLARTGLVAIDVDGDIWVADADGTGRRQLTRGPAFDWEPLWSPDGTKLVYWSAPNQNATRHLMLMDMTGAGGSRPASVVATVSNPADWRVGWAPDSRRLAYSDSVGGISSIYVIDLVSLRPIAVCPSSADCTDPAWSPDGRHIAFLAHRTDTQRALYVVAPDGSDLRRLTTIPSRGDGFLVPVWSPTGDRLAFAAETSGSDPFQRDIWTVGLDGAPEVDISNDPADESDPEWSPDGASVAYVRRDGIGQYRWHVVVTRVVDTHSATLPPDVINGTAGWSPDARLILAYQVDQVAKSNDHVIVIDPESGRVTVVADGLATGVGSWQRLAP